MRKRCSMSEVTEVTCLGCTVSESHARDHMLTIFHPALATILHTGSKTRSFAANALEAPLQADAARAPCTQDSAAPCTAIISPQISFECHSARCSALQFVNGEFCSIAWSRPVTTGRRHLQPPDRFVDVPKVPKLAPNSVVTQDPHVCTSQTQPR